VETHLPRRRTKCDIVLTAPPRWRGLWQNDSITTAQSESVSVRSGHSRISPIGEFFRRWMRSDPLGSGTLCIPGAEGYAPMPGGRGGKVPSYQSQRLRREVCVKRLRRKGPRTVIFRVGGIIETKGLYHPRTLHHHRRPDRSRRRHLHQETDSDGNALICPVHYVIIRFCAFARANKTGQFRSESFRAPTATTSSLTIARAVGATPNLSRLRGVARSHRCSGASSRKATTGSGMPSPPLWLATGPLGTTTLRPTWGPAFALG